MTTNFIYDNTGVPIGKANAAPLPPGANPAQWGVAAEWIQICQALLDVQAFCRGASWFGLQAHASDPAPAGITNYLWLKTDGSLWKTLSGVPSLVSVGTPSTVTGSRGGNAALASLLTVLQSYGLIIDGTTP